MDKEKNLISQRLAEAREKGLDDKRTMSEHIKEITDIYYSAKNNEEKEYLNAQDSRYLEKTPHMKASELGFNFEGDPVLHTGGCLRRSYFDIRNYNKERRVDYKDIVYIEDSEFMKSKYMEMLRISGLIIEEDPVEEIKFNGVTIKGHADALIYNPVSDAEELLIVKSVNGTAANVKKAVFGYNAEPMQVHMAELAAIGIIFKRAIRLVYINKNDFHMIKEFRIGFADECLTFNGARVRGFDLNSLLASITIFRDMLENDYIPDRSFKPYTNKDADGLEGYKIVLDFVAEKLRTGETNVNFKCMSCPYKTMCNELGDGTFKP